MQPHLQVCSKIKSGFLSRDLRDADFLPEKTEMYLEWAGERRVLLGDRKNTQAKYLKSDNVLLLNCVFPNTGVLLNIKQQD